MTAFAKTVAAVLAVAMIGMPVAASAQGATQAASASSLSLSRSPAFSVGHGRASAKRGSESKIFGLPVVLVALAAAALTAAIVVVADDNGSSSN